MPVREEVVIDRPTNTASRRRPRDAGIVGLLAVGLVAGVLLRLYSASGLWLDEAQSVAIAKLPLHQLPSALRHDGSPPLYYLLLHGWLDIFGDSPGAARSLSVVFGLVTIPTAYWAARAVGDRVTGWVAAALMAGNAFAIRYSTEARMYALLTLLATVGVLALARAHERPSWPRLALVSLVSGLLALTHYWALFLLAVVVTGLGFRSLRGDHRPTARRQLVAVLAGGVLFLPWLTSFLYQIRHTGTPWAAPPGWGSIGATVRQWGGPGAHADASELAYPIVIVLVLAALMVRRGQADDGKGVRLGRPADGVALALTTAAIGTLVLGVAVSRLVGSGYAVRYSAAAVGPMIVLIALGARRLPARVGFTLAGLVVALGLATSVDAPFTTLRTQAVATAAVLRAQASPADLVVYCPDQLGPAVSRLLPSRLPQVTYPSLGAPARVDWVDYAQRNAAAVPARVALTVSQKSSGAVWLVEASGYRTFGSQCGELDNALATLRCGRHVFQSAVNQYFEHEAVVRFAPCSRPTANTTR